MQTTTIGSGRTNLDRSNLQTLIGMLTRMDTGRLRSAIWTSMFAAAALVIGLSGFAAQAQSIRYLYDDLGRLHQVIDAQGNAATYNYDAVGNILSIERGAPSCPLQAPSITKVTSATCYAGTTCLVTLEGNSLLGASVSTGTPQATLSNCQAQCAQITCSLDTVFDFAASTVPLTVTTSFGSAQGAAPINAAPAIMSGGGADLWHFAGNAGQVVSIAMSRIPNQQDGSSTLDPYLELQDSRGFVVAVDDDSGSNLPAGPGKNALIQNLTLPATDTYVLRASGAGGTYGPYILNLRPATIPLVPGAIVSPPEGRRLTFAGTIVAVGQRNTVAFAANAGDRATIAVNRVTNNPDGSGSLDPAVELRDSRGFSIASDSDTGTNDPPGPGHNALVADFVLPATDTYQVIVSGEGGSIGPYQVVVTLHGSAASGPQGNSVSSAKGNGGNP
ncbi:MAG: RHS repeat protein [Deltaproteobacteria bacterium]|nr:RHS repeat protein [Deltaproteobacteria bacterium]